MIPNQTKVIAQYIWQKVKVTNERYIDGGYIGMIIGVCSVRGLLVEHDKGSDADERFDDCQLILKPLSAITDEDAIEVAKILFGQQYSIGEVPRNNEYEVLVTVSIPDTTRNQSVRIGFDGSLNNCSGYGLQNALIAFQYLQSKGYDLPQHLLGGKTLQQAGLAIYE